MGTMSSHLRQSIIMWEKEYIHVCVTGSPCCTAEKINKLNYTSAHQGKCLEHAFTLHA